MLSARNYCEPDPFEPRFSTLIRTPLAACWCNITFRENYSEHLMSATTLEIRPELKMQLDHLAEEIHRSESDLANEAVTLYLAQQHRIIGRIQEGLAQAQRGEFVTDEEMEAFFARYTDSQAY